MSESAAQTEALGRVWGEVARPGSLFLLRGDLGAGKTTLVRGLGRGLGIENRVKSPSFAIHLAYPGRLTLHHLDLYRIHQPRDLQELGLEDVMGRDGVCVVEWCERLGPETPEWGVLIRFEDLEPETRRLTVSGDQVMIQELARAAGIQTVETGTPENP